MVFYCPKCQKRAGKKAGKIQLERVTRTGLQKFIFQTYRCMNGHLFTPGNIHTAFSNSFIEYVAALYLRSLSLNTAIQTVRLQFEKDLLSKQTVLDFIEKVADKIPTLDDIDNLFHPRKSGYLALDGVWYKYRGINFVLLISFDPVTFDIVSYLVCGRESFETYQKLIKRVSLKLRNASIKGVYCDGDRGLIKAVKLSFPGTPIQTCVVHKEFRLGQLLPFKRAYIGKSLDPKFKEKVRLFKETAESIIYAETKKEAKDNFDQLQKFMVKQKDEKFKKAFGSLKYNFKYLLTHFDHPEMERDNNIIEGFNSIIKRRLKLLKGFKKPTNIDRYIKLVLLDYRFHEFIESRFVKRRNKTPLELAGVSLPKYYNFIKYLRETLNLDFTS